MKFRTILLSAVTLASLLFGATAPAHAAGFTCNSHTESDGDVTTTCDPNLPERSPDWYYTPANMGLISPAQQDGYNKCVNTSMNEWHKDIGVAEGGCMLVTRHKGYSRPQSINLCVASSMPRTQWPDATVRPICEWRYDNPPHFAANR